MKFFLAILFCICFSPFSYGQKISARLLKVDQSDKTEWQILNESKSIEYSGIDFSETNTDTISFSLEANRHYFLRVSSSESYNPNRSIYLLYLNDELILRINSELKPGIQNFPFFTGIRNEGSKIIGGSDATIQDFPWQVFFVSGGNVCGATIISRDYVLTAAHCTQEEGGGSVAPAAMRLYTGSSSLFSTGDLYTVAGVTVHEGYNRETLENDIALLQLTSPITTKYAVPIKLINSDDVSEGYTDPGVMSWVTGWGLMQISTIDKLAATLQKAQLPIVSRAQASTVWHKIPSTSIMAGYLDGHKDACSGDSGGPLVVPVMGEFKLAGIVSWGSQNCDSYSGFTCVSCLEDWIRTKSGIAREFKPKAAKGETIICLGTENSIYTVETVPNATAYEWKLFPQEAGVITGNSVNSSVLWNLGYTGPVTVGLRATINNIISDWSKLYVYKAKNTRLLNQTNDTTICAGQAVVLNSEAEGYDLVYNWYQNGILIKSGTESNVELSGAATSESAEYVCKITGACGTLFSDIINLNVLPLTAVASVSPGTKTGVNFGGEIALVVNANGHNLTYGWEKDGVLIRNSNSPQLIMPNAKAKDIGLYRVKVSGTCGTETSDSVYVYVRETNFSSDADVFVWPTITSEYINVALSNEKLFTIRIINSSGQVVIEKKNCQYQNTIDLKSLPKGIYFAAINNGSFHKTVKVIKE